MIYSKPCVWDEPMIRRPKPKNKEEEDEGFIKKAEFQV